VGAAILTAIASVAGMVVPGLYRDRDALVRLTQADDVFRLAIVLPILAIGLSTAAHGSINGRLAALGALATLAYLHAFLVFGAALSAATLAHIAILGVVTWRMPQTTLGRPVRLSSRRTGRAFDAGPGRYPVGGEPGKMSPTATQPGPVVDAVIVS